MLCLLGLRVLKIDHIFCLAIDAGCPNFEEALWHRAHQHDTDAWWKAMEWRRNNTPTKHFRIAGIPVNWSDNKEGDV